MGPPSERMGGGSIGDSPLLPSESFEAVFDELERIVRRLESGAESLDETLALFERGTELASQCERILGAAELRVRRLAGDPADDDDPALA